MSKLVSKKLEVRKVKEKDVRRVVTDFLKHKKVFYWWNLQGLGSYPGLPDIMCIYKGRFIAIELKAPGKKPSERQSNFLEQINNNGHCIGIVVDNVDMLIREFRRIDFCM